MKTALLAGLFLALGLAIGLWAESSEQRRLASAVATQEARDEDSSWVTRQTFNETAVAIRRARKLADGWRGGMAQKVRERRS